MTDGVLRVFRPGTPGATYSNQSATLGVHMEATKNDTIWATAERSRSDEQGQTIVEYALVVTAISIGSIAVLATMTDRIAFVFNTLGSAL